MTPGDVRWMAHHLALALGYTVAELLRRMTLAEWQSWREFYELEVTPPRRQPQTVEQQKATIMRAMEKVGAVPHIRTNREQ